MIICNGGSDPGYRNCYLFDHRISESLSDRTPVSLANLTGRVEKGGSGPGMIARGAIAGTTVDAGSFHSIKNAIVVGTAAIGNRKFGTYYSSHI